MAVSKEKTVVVVFAVAVVLGLMAFSYIWRPSGSLAPGQPRPEFAPRGELASSFPRELVLDGNAKVGNSFSADYGSGMVQNVATFSSNRSLNAVADEYKAYLEGNGWAITNEINKYKNSRGLYATKDKLEISVSILDKGSEREIALSYISK